MKLSTEVMENKTKVEKPQEHKVEQKVQQEARGQIGYNAGMPIHKLNSNLGPRTWLIGQWHPEGFDHKGMPKTWRMIKPGEVCPWKDSNGNHIEASAYHPDCMTNQQHATRYEFMHKK